MEDKKKNMVIAKVRKLSHVKGITIPAHSDIEIGDYVYIIKVEQ